MNVENILILFGAGSFAGILAGFLGIGGGVLLFPLLIWLGFIPKEAAATSLLSIALTSSSGTWQNWRMGYIKPRQVLMLGIPSMISVKIGADIGESVSSATLLIGFGILLITNIFLFEFRKWVIKRKQKNNLKSRNSALFIYPIGIGGLAGLLAGLFGVGGGVILVPLQIFILGEPIKSAIQISLGVIFLTSFSGCIAQTWNGNIQFAEGVILGIGGILGAQISTRFLPKLPEGAVTFAFRSLLLILAIYTFNKAASI